MKTAITELTLEELSLLRECVVLELMDAEDMADKTVYNEAEQLWIKRLNNIYIKLNTLFEVKNEQI